MVNEASKDQAKSPISENIIESKAKLSRIINSTILRLMTCDVLVFLYA